MSRRFCDAARLAFDRRASSAPAIVAASGCAPPMPPRPAVRIHLPSQIAAEVLTAHFDERLVRALHDALAADVDPRARRHLAEHHQAAAIEFVEVLPRRPVRHEIRIREQHARRIGVRAEHADRLARLDQQRLVAASSVAASRRCGRSIPSCARRGRCRRTRRAPRGSRPPRDRDCSSACAAALRSASSSPCSCVPRGARTGRAPWLRSSDGQCPSVHGHSHFNLVASRACSRRRSPSRRNGAGPAPASDRRP